MSINSFSLTEKLQKIADPLKIFYINMTKLFSKWVSMILKDEQTFAAVYNKGPNLDPPLHLRAKSTVSQVDNSQTRNSWQNHDVPIMGCPWNVVNRLPWKIPDNQQRSLRCLTSALERRNIKKRSKKTMAKIQIEFRFAFAHTIITRFGSKQLFLFTYLKKMHTTKRFESNKGLRCDQR